MIKEEREWKEDREEKNKEHEIMEEGEKSIMKEGKRRNDEEVIDIERERSDAGKE